MQLGGGWEKAIGLDTTTVRKSIYSTISLIIIPSPLRVR